MFRSVLFILSGFPFLHENFWHKRGVEFFMKADFSLVQNTAIPLWPLLNKKMQVELPMKNDFLDVTANGGEKGFRIMRSCPGTKLMIRKASL